MGPFSTVTVCVSAGSHPRISSTAAGGRTGAGGTGARAQAVTSPVRTTAVIRRARGRRWKPIVSAANRVHATATTEHTGDASPASGAGFARATFPGDLTRGAGAPLV